MSFAAPSGGSVTSGSATINQNGSITTINQSTNKASINWQDFSIGKTETVNFVQPSAQSVTLNRVVGTTQSLIEGAMNANGQVFLLNPNGVLFANGAQVNVGGLVASTLNLSDANFQAGNYTFEGNSQNSIINMGTITANNGYVAMMGKHVANKGTIVATMGNVQMASGEKISLNLNGNSLVKLTIDQGTMDALVENKGLIKADGGQVYLTTQALNTILDGMVNNTGIIEAQTLNDVTGKVILFAHGGTANIGGTIDASAPNDGNGGFIETSGDKVKIDDRARIITKANQGISGTWLIDPVDFTIAASGGDMTGTTLTTNLANGNVIIQSSQGRNGTDGNINVNDRISWNTNTLTLEAYQHININAIMRATGTAGLVLITDSTNQSNGGHVFIGIDYSTGAFKGSIDLASTSSININGTAYTIINSLGAEGSTTGTDLQGINGNLSGNYVLGSNIDAADTANTWSAAGFNPIGSSSSYFAGIFNGLGHTISNLLIDRSTTSYIGLFGGTMGAKIESVGLINADITGRSYVGGLVGFATNSNQIINSYITGSVASTANPTFYIGGLVGYNRSSSLIFNSYSTADVTVSHGESVGGLVGVNDGSGIMESYSTGDVTASNNYVGGLVGWNKNAAYISSSYSTGDVTAAHTAGGLVGNSDGSSIANSYSTGNVTAAGLVGGLVGQVRSGEIVNSYSIGTVVGTETYIGGFAGYGAGIGTNSFWNSDTSGQSSNGLAGSTVIGKTTSEMKSLATFNSTTPAWDIVEDSSLSNGYPQLRWTKSGLNAGTSVWVIGGARPTPLTRPHYDITTIVNSTAVTPPIPRVIAPIAPKPTQAQIKTTELLQTMMPKGDTYRGSYNLVGTTDGNAPVQTVSMDQLQSAALTQGVGEIRVPLGNGSVVDLINGGVTLPKGVSQEFYVVATNRT
ncbi:filamentous hemagglutinin N-terminal domain-containing protein, partial [Sulfuricurvum sp. PD_MW2]|uniref:two-partner secretion domain-containing protein n=1 Tax=Sulfuricurvum sp. PD_MW2 TaxID=2027917 RepID=UPI0025E2F785